MRTRRALLVGGAGAAALALGGLGWRAWDRGVWSGGEGPAYAPWSDWRGSAADGSKRPLRAAILAANPHDTQPWLFTVEENAITVFADRARHLGAFDPFRREMHLGLGAAVENLVLAARARGVAATIAAADGTLSLSPDETPIRAAHIALTPIPAARDALVDAIPNRHTNRGPYRADQAIVAATLRRFADLAGDDAVRVVFVADSHARGELGALIVEATERIIRDPQMSTDSARWFRTGRRDIAAHRDGVTVDTAGLSPLITAASKLLPDLDAPSADRYWLSITRETQVPTAPVLGMLLVRDRLDMRSAIAAGRAWQRLHLAATGEGLAAQPLNQPVECIDRDAMLGKADVFGPALAKLAQASAWEPTFVFRLGVAERATGPSPRRALEEVLRT
ncbi:MAG: Acg family FMN-binding oxidoreductase [Stellaceae bacterium]